MLPTSEVKDVILLLLVEQRLWQGDGFGPIQMMQAIQVITFYFFFFFPEILSLSLSFFNT